jgi:hypothetical protein
MQNFWPAFSDFIRPKNDRQPHVIASASAIASSIAAIHYACSLKEGDGINETRPCIELFNAIQGLLRAGEFAALDEAIAAADVVGMPAIIITALPRYCFVARQSLPSWQAFVARGHAELVRRGEDADDIMRGLV